MTALGTSGGATATNTGALTYTARTFKDFHLQLKYRATATNNNGGVLLRNGEQVAILDNGTAATRSGAIVGLAPTTSAQARPVREWNTLDVIAYGDRITSRLNGVEVASGISTRAQEGTIGLENAGNNLMYADVRIKALATDTTKPTVTVSSARRGPDVPAGRARQAGLRLRRRAGPDRVRREPVQHRHARAASRSRSPPVTRPATRPSSRATTASPPTRPRRCRSARPSRRRSASRSARPRRSARSCRAWRASTRRPRPRTSSAPRATPRSPSADPGHLANGAFTLPQPLRVEIAPESLERPGLQRPVHDHVQTGDRRHRRRAHRHLQPDAHVHVVNNRTIRGGVPHAEVVRGAVSRVAGRCAGAGRRTRPRAARRPPSSRRSSTRARSRSVELTKAYIDRIAAVNQRGPAINAVRSLNPNALQEARVSDIARRTNSVRGPLEGLPVLLKDNIDVAGMPTTASSIVLERSVPDKDATIVRRLKAAGRGDPRQGQPDRVRRLRVQQRSRTATARSAARS